MATDCSNILGADIVTAIRSIAIDYGVATASVSVGGNSLSDSAKRWVPNTLRNCRIRILTGTGRGLNGVISGNSPDSLAIYSSWSASISAGDTYVIVDRDTYRDLLDVLGGSTVSLKPIEKSALQNQLVVAAANIIAANLTPTNTPSIFRIAAGLDAAGILSVVIIRGGNTQVQRFNGGVALNTDSLYEFEHFVHLGDTINYRYSVNATLQTFRVQEVAVGV